MPVENVVLLVVGFLFGVVFPALIQRLRTPPSGNEAEVGAV